MTAKARKVKPAAVQLPDIFPKTEVAALDRAAWIGRSDRFALDAVAPLVGMQPTFITKATGQRKTLSVDDVLLLLDQDAYGETFVRRSQVLDFLHAQAAAEPIARREASDEPCELIVGEVTTELQKLPSQTPL